MPSLFLYVHTVTGSLFVTSGGPTEIPSALLICAGVTRSHDTDADPLVPLFPVVTAIVVCELDDWDFDDVVVDPDFDPDDDPHAASASADVVTTTDVMTARTRDIAAPQGAASR